MAKNVLIIKGADFSGNKVETIPLIEQYVYNYENMLYVDKHLQINGNSMSNHDNYFGGFINSQDFRDSDIKIINDAGSSYLSFIKDVDFDAKTFTYCSGTSQSFISGNTIYNSTIPTDCDYIYILIHDSSHGYKSTTAIVDVPI